MVAFSQPLLTENFNFSGTLTSNGWSAHSGSGTNAISSGATGLEYSGYGGSGIGNAASMTTSGEDVNRSFTAQTSGSIYAAFLIKVSAAQNAGDYFFHLGGSTLGTNFYGRVFVKNSGSNFQMGVAMTTGTVSYGSTNFNYNQTYLVVLKYTIVSGTTNDQVAIFVNPNLSSEPGSAEATANATAADPTNIGTVALRQGTASNSATLLVDGIRIATSWTTLIGGTPAINLSPATVTGLSYQQGGGPSVASTVSVSGSVLNPQSGSVSVVAPSNFEVSSDNSTFNNNASLNYSNGAFTSNLFVRLKAGLGPGTYTGTVTFNGGSATAELPVSGYLTLPNVGPCNGAITPIANARSLSNTTIVTIEGRVTVSTQFGGKLMFIQDGTGGIALFSNNSPAIGTAFNVGDLVQVRGAMDTFNGKREVAISGSDANNCLQKKDNTNITPVPISITASQADLLANEGRLVSISGVTMTSCQDVFYGSTNYTFSQSSNNSELRIDPNTNLSGYQKPSGSFTLTGIIDRFNALLQVMPRYVDDVPGVTTPSSSGAACGGSAFAPSNSSLDVVAWNVEWLGHPANGPSSSGANDATQLANVKTILGGLNADLISLEEVCDLTMFNSIVTSLGSNYRGECSPAVSGSVPDANPQRVCIIYNSSVITKVSSQVLLNGATSLPGYPTTPSQFWASGRKPFLFVGDATIDGQTRRIHVVAVHAKSGDATDDYARRQYDVQVLYDTLNTKYPDANIIFLGDFNDDLDASIAVPKVSSYQNFVNDAARYNPLTKAALSLNGCATTATYCDAIDHIVVSNEFAPAYIAGTAASLRPNLTNYKNTTTDHFPVVARFNIANALNCVYNTATASQINTNPVCAGQTLNLSVTTIPTSAIWSGPNGFTQSGLSVSVPTIKSVNAGIYTVSAYNQGCTSTITATVSITVQHEVLISSNSPLCLGSTIAFGTNYGSNGSYVWAGPNSYSSTKASPTIPNATYVRAGNYSVTVSVSNCIMTATSNVSVVPVIGIQSNSPVCTGGTLQLTASGGSTYLWRGPYSNNFSSTQQSPSISDANSSHAGTYTVTVTYANGCSNSATINIKVTAPTVVKVLSNSPVCFGGTIQLTASATGTYSWRGPYNFNSTLKSPSVTDANVSTKAGNYSVTVTTLGGCISTGSVYVRVVNCAARLASEEATEPKVVMALSPNPTNRKVNVTIQLSDAQPVELHLTDLTGRTLDTYHLTNTAAEHQVTIDLEGKRTGLYLLVAVTNKERVVKKVMKIE